MVRSTNDSITSPPSMDENELASHSSSSSSSIGSGSSSSVGASIISVIGIESDFNISISSSSKSDTGSTLSSSGSSDTSSSSSGDIISAQSNRGGIASVIDLESDLLVGSSQDSCNDEESSLSTGSQSSHDSNMISIGSVQRERKNDNHRYGINIERQMFLTEEDVLFFGLTYAGFGEERQNVRDSLSIDRFKAHFGPEPRTVRDILLDLEAEFRGDIVFKDVMMAMNWLKLCELSMHHAREDLARDLPNIMLTAL